MIARASWRARNPPHHEQGVRAIWLAIVCTEGRHGRCHVRGGLVVDSARAMWSGRLMYSTGMRICYRGMMGYGSKLIEDGRFKKFHPWDQGAVPGLERERGRTEQGVQQ